MLTHFLCQSPSKSSVNATWTSQTSLSNNPPLKSLLSHPIPPPPAPPPPPSPECTPKPSLNLQLRILLQPILQHFPHPSSYAPIFQFLTRHNFIKLGQQAHAQLSSMASNPMHSRRQNGGNVCQLRGS
ncbi:hypothetical protein CK203_023467 [Vitis vinifera]|uniref:Uncharacterized protein n=1 Tax=Vitis vinifera TaxID=29760 RepID=A0A438J6E4_VITVI|nr:hypothetical protein CK203_023467 [Vitis vinifera]